jgi:hypothetical protein
MEDGEKPGTNMVNGSVIVAALAAIGIYYFHREAPLVRLMYGQHSGKDDDTHTKIIGPHSSDTLKDMVTEARDDDVSKWVELRNVQFYAYGASAPDRQLLNKADDTLFSG